MSDADLTVGQLITCVFGGANRMIKNKISLPGIITGIAIDGTYNVRIVADGIIIDIAGLGLEHISTKAI